MKKTEFFDLVAQPNLLDEESFTALNEIVAEFPWFQSARMLLVKNLHVLDHVRFNGELKLSAAFINDRSRLFQLIHQKNGDIEDESRSFEKDTAEVVAERVEDSPIEKRSSSVELSTKVKSVADYFQTDDVFESNGGEQVDFSFSKKKKRIEENDSSMVLPSADFLGYESSDFVGYELKETIHPVEKVDESHSFSDWLTVLRHAPIEAEAAEKPVKKKSHQLIDNFLNMDTPKILAKPNELGDEPHKIKATVEESTMENDDLMSETLADIYIKQKHYKKAIGIYEKLRLKYPEKNVYFARRISDLEKLTN